jgi:hypothetical protein
MKSASCKGRIEMNLCSHVGGIGVLSQSITEQKIRTIGRTLEKSGLKKRGGLGDLGGLAIFLGKYEGFKTATRPPSGGLGGKPKVRAQSTRIRTHEQEECDD